MSFTYARTVFVLMSAAFLLLSCGNDTVILKRHIAGEQPPVLAKQVFNFNYQTCANIYTGEGIAIVELHCQNKDNPDGIYIVDASSVMRFDWFDPQFNAWAWQEGCNDNASCYYEAQRDKTGKINALTYFFYINLSEGSYQLSINGDSIKIRQKTIHDSPS